MYADEDATVRGWGRNCTRMRTQLYAKNRRTRYATLYAVLV